MIEEVNTARAALYGDLARKAADAGLPLDWPSRFFRRAWRVKEAAPLVPPAFAENPTPAPTGA